MCLTSPTAACVVTVYDLDLLAKNQIGIGILFGRLPGALLADPTSFGILLRAMGPRALCHYVMTIQVIGHDLISSKVVLGSFQQFAMICCGVENREIHW